LDPLENGILSEALRHFPHCTGANLSRPCAFDPQSELENTASLPAVCSTNRRI
jgi:hypothetical protein